MLNDEKLLSLRDATKAVPRSVHPSALWRWLRRGIQARNGQRIYLEGVRAGGGLFTSVEAIRRFFAAVAAADAEHFAARQNNHQSRPTDICRRRAVARAKSEMSEDGL